MPGTFFDPLQNKETLKQVTEAKLRSISTNGSAPPSTVEGPWTQDKNEFEKNSLFPSIEIKGKRWDQIFPYRLVVVKPVGANKFSVVANDIDPFGTPKFTTSATSNAAGRLQIDFVPTDSSWSFQLPITPQQLSISNSFAINSMATLRGYGEEHGGTKFKIISMSGTFGVWPYRGNVNPSAQEPANSLQTLFGGTLQAFSNLRANITRTVSAFSGDNPNPPPSTPNVENSIGSFAGTGYAQALLLDQFLEQYAERKKTAAWADYRLAFDIPKQNQTFLVTPVMFSYSQAADSPNEFKFQLQLKAFRRITLDQNATALTIAPADPQSSNTLQNVLRGLSEARRALGSAYNLVRAVRSDVNTPFNALRETSLFVKGLAGLAASIIDLPDNIIQDAKFAIADSLSNIQQAGSIVRGIGAKLSKDVESVKAFKREREGLPLGTAIDENTVLSSKTSPINKLFDIPAQNFDLFDLISTEEVLFSEAAQVAIDREVDRVSLLTADDIKKNKQIIQDLAFQISNAFGTGDQTFARIYSKSEPRARLQPITIDEYDILKKLYEVVQGLDILTLNDQINLNQQSAYEFVQAEADDAGITFAGSSAKIKAPVPFGLTIEQIASRYLGNSERWLEIVTLNNLKSPYIDETGFVRPFLSNGDGRQFTISSADDMFVGQRIQLFSTTQAIQRRRIIDIEQINESNFLITVDGLDNLDIFTTAQNAQMRAFLPGTVNSQDQIFIPSDLPVRDDLVTRPVPVTQDDALTGLSKIDLLLTDNNDLAVDPFGDLRFSFGLTNLFQALKLKFITEPGSLLRSPEFGSGLRPGISNADLTADNVFNTISKLISQDPRFAGIDRLQVVQEGPIFTVNLSVFIANGLGVYPISFQLAS